MAVWSEVQLSRTFEEGRLDADYWQPEYLEMEKRLASMPNERFIDLVKFVRCGPFGSNLLCDTYIPNGVIVLRPFNIKGLTIEQENLVSIPHEDCESNGLHYYKEEDLVFARVGDIRAGIIRNFIQDITISPNIIAARPNREKSNPYFLNAFMNTYYGQMQLLRAMKVVAQPTIAVDIVKEIIVPKVPKVIQITIEEMTKLAFVKSSESYKLYKTAEHQLLQELGLIELDLAHELCYERTFKEASGVRRIDAEYFQPKYYRLEEGISDCGHPVKKLGSLIAPINNGFDFRDFDEEGTAYIRVGDVRHGEIDDDAAKKIRLTSEDITKDVKLKVGDVLFTRKGSFGNAAVVRPGQESAIISSEIMLLRVKDKALDPDYLTVYLNSELGYQQVERRAHGVAFYSISQLDLADISVIIAPEALQTEIKEKVQAAYSAKQEAKRLLDGAKQLIEDAISKG